MSALINSLPKLLTGAEVLKALRIEKPKAPHATLFRLRQKGLRGVRVGRTFKYPEREVAKLLSGELG